jgi:hypothetical protein
MPKDCAVSGGIPFSIFDLESDGFRPAHLKPSDCRGRPGLPTFRIPGRFASFVCLRVRVW